MAGKRVKFHADQTKRYLESESESEYSIEQERINMLLKKIKIDSKFGLCYICSSDFAKMDELVMHVKMEHGIKYPRDYHLNSKKDKLVCRKCPTFCSKTGFNPLGTFFQHIVVEHERRYDEDDEEYDPNNESKIKASRELPASKKNGPVVKLPKLKAPIVPKFPMESSSSKEIKAFRSNRKARILSNDSEEEEQQKEQKKEQEKKEKVKIKVEPLTKNDCLLPPILKNKMDLSSKKRRLCFSTKVKSDLPAVKIIVPMKVDRNTQTDTIVSPVQVQVKPAPLEKPMEEVTIKETNLKQRKLIFVTPPRIPNVKIAATLPPVKVAAILPPVKVAAILPPATNTSEIKKLALKRPSMTPSFVTFSSGYQFPHAPESNAPKRRKWGYAHPLEFRTISNRSMRNINLNSKDGSSTLVKKPKPKLFKCSKCLINFGFEIILKHHVCNLLDSRGFILKNGVKFPSLYNI